MSDSEREQCKTFNAGIRKKRERSDTRSDRDDQNSSINQVVTQRRTTYDTEEHNSDEPLQRKVKFTDENKSTAKHDDTQNKNNTCKVTQRCKFLQFRVDKQE